MAYSGFGIAVSLVSSCASCNQKHFHSSCLPVPSPLLHSPFECLQSSREPIPASADMHMPLPPLNCLLVFVNWPVLLPTQAQEPGAAVSGHDVKTAESAAYRPTASFRKYGNTNAHTSPGCMSVATVCCRLRVLRGQSRPLQMKP